MLAYIKIYRYKIFYIYYHCKQHTNSNEKDSEDEVIYSKFFYAPHQSLNQITDLPAENLVCMFINNKLMDDYMLNIFVKNGNTADDFINNKTIVTLDIINDMQDKVFHGIKSYELESLKNYLSDGWMCFYSSSHYFNGFKKKNKYFVSYIYDNKFDNAIIECENNMPFNECMTFDKRIKYIENELQARLHSIVKIINITAIREE